MGDADIAPPFDGLVSSPAPLTLCGKLHTNIHCDAADTEDISFSQKVTPVQF